MHKQIGIGTSKMPHMLIVNTLQGLESRLFISNALYLQMLLVLVKCLECWPSYLGTCMPCKCQVAGSICTRSGLYSKPTRSNNICLQAFWVQSTIRSSKSLYKQEICKSAHILFLLAQNPYQKCTNMRLSKNDQMSSFMVGGHTPSLTQIKV